MRISDWSSDVCSSDLLVSLPDKFPGLAQPGMIQSFYTFDFERLADLAEQNYQVCSNPATGSAQPGTCLANFNTDRRITEKTLAPYLQVATVFDLFQNPAHFTAGIRYESTDISSAALVPVPVTTRWIGDNELNVRTEEHTSELQSLMRISYAVFCLKKKTK